MPAGESAEQMTLHSTSLRMEANKQQHQTGVQSPKTYQPQTHIPVDEAATPYYTIQGVISYKKSLAGQCSIHLQVSTIEVKELLVLT